MSAPEWWRNEIGARTLTAEKRSGPWTDWSEDSDDPIERNGEYWTVIDRVTGEQVGSFGLPVQMATEQEALDETERFGSKWGWSVEPGGRAL